MKVGKLRHTRLEGYIPGPPSAETSLRNRRGPARTSSAVDPSLTTVLQQCIAAHFISEEVGPVPEEVAESWRQACEARLQELYRPVPLPFLSRSSGGLERCELILVGVFHRDAINPRLVRDAIGAPKPDAVALEARPSFLTSYAQLADSLPGDLVQRMFEVPLHDLQSARGHVSLEARLAWHEVLLTANQELYLAASRQRATGHATAAAAAAAANATAIAAADSAAAAPAAPAHVSPSSALAPAKVVTAFLAGELVLSEKLAAVLAAEEQGVPLHGIELDEAAAYAGLLQGPVTGGRRGAAEPDAGKALGAGAGAGAGSGGYGGRGSGAGLAGGGDGAGGGALGVDHLEAEQRRLALASLEPHVAAAFQDWFRSVPEGDFSRVLQQQLAGLMPQCMSPESYLSYVDETEALWSDERRVGRAAAAQHEQLSARREAHFLEQLRRAAAGGGAGGTPCRRLVAVLGRAHAARLRRALLLQSGPTPPPPPPPARSWRGLGR